MFMIANNAHLFGILVAFMFVGNRHNCNSMDCFRIILSFDDFSKAALFLRNMKCKVSYCSKWLTSARMEEPNLLLIDYWSFWKTSSSFLIETPPAITRFLPQLPLEKIKLECFGAPPQTTLHFLLSTVWPQGTGIEFVPTMTTQTFSKTWCWKRSSVPRVPLTHTV